MEDDGRVKRRRTASRRVLPDGGPRSAPDAASGTARTWVGKDEMNLSDYPIALLSDRPTGQREIRIAYPIEGRGGRPTTAEWVVTGSESHGLPLSGDVGVFLVLLDLTRDRGFLDRTVQFRWDEILSRLYPGGAAFGGYHYQRVRAAIDRLVGVTIYANRWYDRAERRHFDVRFHLLEKAFFYEETPDDAPTRSRMHAITWDSTLFKSFQDGYLKQLDLDRYFAFSSTLARQLFRFLDKRFYDGKPRFEIHLRALACHHLGMVAYSYDSEFKKKFAPAHAELIAAGFLGSVEFRKGREGVVVVYTPGANRGAPAPAAGPDPADVVLRLPSLIERLPEPETRAETPPPGELSGDLLDSVIAAGVSRDVARTLLEAFEAPRIREKLAYLPYARAKNPGGWLRRAIENDWQAPADYPKPKAPRKRRPPRGREPDLLAAVLDAALSERSAAAREALESQAIAAARERHPLIARQVDRGRGGPAWTALVRAELARLVLPSAPLSDDRSVTGGDDGGESE